MIEDSLFLSLKLTFTVKRAKIGEAKGNSVPITKVLFYQQNINKN